MNRESPVNSDLTIMDREPEWYLADLPVSIAKSVESDVFVRAKLSPLTRRVMERYYAKKAQKKEFLRSRKESAVRGRHHHNTKKATRRRLLKKRWKDNPFGCVIYGYGAYSIDKALWEKYIAPLWEQHDPSHLKVVRYRKNLSGVPLGTQENPYTIYDLKVVHSALGVVYDGQNQKIYDIQTGSL
jgi:hypothetical protein